MSRRRKPLGEMTEPEIGDTLKGIGRMIDQVLAPGTLWTLLVYDDPGLAQYISKGRRDDCIRAMRECADRLERRETLERINFEDGG